MTTSNKKILEMVTAGKISPEEAQKLLGAIEQGKTSRWKLLLNPFARLSDNQGLVVSALVVLLSIIAATQLRVRFDGALDVHIVLADVGLGQAVVDQVVSCLGLALLLWGASLLMTKQGRLLDFCFVAVVGRIALVLFGLVLGIFLPDPSVLLRIATNTPYHPVVIAIALLGVFFYGWYFTWLFQGFKTASGLTQTRLVAVFIAAVFAAEVMTKVVLLVVPAIPATVPAVTAAANPHVLSGTTPTERAQSFLQLLEGGRFEDAWSCFDSKMAQALSPTRLKWTYGAIKWESGDFQEVEEIRHAPQGGTQVVDLICVFEKRRAVVRVVFDTERRVSGLWFRPPESALPKQDYQQ